MAHSWRVGSRKGPAGRQRDISIIYRCISLFVSTTTDELSGYGPGGVHGRWARASASSLNLLRYLVADRTLSAHSSQDQRPC